ncbi:MAG: hypothetical protein ISS36_01900 [Candidatus Aenigmarchaeota archaeon]|nr:hypothetical protein [Candidatus Aenigmarchaeota archaeon]
MGLFDFLKKGEEPKPISVQTVRLQLTELDNWLDKELSQSIEEIKSKAKESYDSIKESVLEMKTPIGNLRNAEFGNKKEFAMVNMAKDGFVKKANNVLTGFPSLKTIDYRSLKEFYEKSASLVADLKNIPPKQSILTRKYFPRETAEIINSLKLVDKNLTSLNIFLSEDAKIWNKKEILENKLEKQKEFEIRIKKMENEKIILEEKIKSLDKELLKNQTGLKDIEESREYKKYQEMKIHNNETKLKMESIKNNLIVEITSIRRPLKKIRHDHKNSLLDQAISRPFSIIIENREDDLIDILRELMGKESLKEKEKSKLNKFIEKIPEIRESKKEYFELKEIRNQKKDELKTMDMTGKVKDASEKINKVNGQRDDTGIDFEELNGQIQKTNESLLKNKKRIEELASDLTDKKVNIY